MYVVLDQVASVGRSSMIIQHACGHKLVVYVWSFAGSGRICPGCQEKIKYEDGVNEDVFTYVTTAVRNSQNDRAAITAAIARQERMLPIWRGFVADGDAGVKVTYLEKIRLGKQKMKYLQKVLDRNNVHRTIRPTEDAPTL